MSERVGEIRLNFQQVRRLRSVLHCVEGPITITQDEQGKLRVVERAAGGGEGWEWIVGPRGGVQ